MEHRFASLNVPLAFALGLEVLGNEPDTIGWQKVCEAVLKHYEKMQKNSYGIITNNPEGFCTRSAHMRRLWQKRNDSSYENKSNT